MEGIPEFVKVLRWVVSGIPYIAIISLMLIYVIARTEASKEW